MNKKFSCRKRFIFIPIFVVACVFLVSFLVMFLWNQTLPSIFGLTTITLWQAMGLFLLCKLLFGFGKNPKRGGPPWKRQRNDRDLSGLSEAEKEKFQQYIQQETCFWERSKFRSKGDNPDHVDSI